MRRLPITTSPSRTAARSPGAPTRWLRRILPIILCLVSAGCSGTCIPTLNSHAEASDGPYRLVFELPRPIWRTTEAIEGQATLSLIGRGGVDLSGSGCGRIDFGFVEMGGLGRVMPAAGTGLYCSGGDCSLDVDRPITSPIMKSAAWGADDPNADFYRNWIMSGPEVHLPAGIWTITAWAWPTEGALCDGQSYVLRATVSILVTF